MRLAFESALELMAETRLGTFKMDPSGKSKGPPPAVKKVLSLFGSGKVRVLGGGRAAGFLFLFFFYRKVLFFHYDLTKTICPKKKKKKGGGPPRGLPLPPQGRPGPAQVPARPDRRRRAAVADDLRLLERRGQAERHVDAALPRGRGAGRLRLRRGEL